jgi:hypothetical protein
MYPNKEQSKTIGSKSPKLSSSDMRLMARELNCDVKTIQLVLNGKRGKRNTELQIKIRTLADYRLSQNKAFEELCKKYAKNQ